MTLHAVTDGKVYARRSMTRRSRSVWLRVMEGSSEDAALHLTPDEADAIAESLAEAAAEIRRENDPAHQIQTAINASYGNHATRIPPGVLAHRLADAGYRIVKENES